MNVESIPGQSLMVNALFAKIYHSKKEFYVI